jgi:hypothetical protein
MLLDLAANVRNTLVLGVRSNAGGQLHCFCLPTRAPAEVLGVPLHQDHPGHGPLEVEETSLALLLERVCPYPVPAAVDYQREAEECRLLGAAGDIPVKCPETEPDDQHGL